MPSYREQRRAEKRAQFDAECEKHMAEQRRKETLSMWERIEELRVDRDLKDVLQLLAEGIKK